MPGDNRDTYNQDERFVKNRQYAFYDDIKVLFAVDHLQCLHHIANKLLVHFVRFVPPLHSLGAKGLGIDFQALLHRVLAFREAHLAF